MRLNTLKITVLSISLATVTSGAAVAPALGIFAEHFSQYPSAIVKLIISLPSIFIIFSNLIFAKASKYLDSKQLSIIGFVLFIIGGVAPFGLDNLYAILCARAVLGIGVGFLMPLSVSLVGYLFDKSEQTKLMGLSGMCNQIGAVIMVSCSGMLASLSWRYSFLIYLFGVGIFVLVMVYLPRVKLASSKQRFDRRNFALVSGFIISMCIVQVLFYGFTNNFAIVYSKLINPSFIGAFMAINAVFGALCSYHYPRILKTFGSKAKYIGGVFYAAAFLLFALRFDSWYEIGGVSLEIIVGALGAICNGIATGTIIPLLVSQISLKSKRQNLSFNMAVCSMALYFGQFISPIIDEICMMALDLHDDKDAFSIAFLIALGFIAYTTRLRLKL